jgi:hypothetical protein
MIKIPLDWWYRLCEKRGVQSRKAFNERHEWHTIFSFLPRVVDKHFVWLRFIQRKSDYVYKGWSENVGSIYGWNNEYRLKETNREV